MSLFPGEPQLVWEMKNKAGKKTGNRTICPQNKNINPEMLHFPHTLHKTGWKVLHTSTLQVWSLCTAQYGVGLTDEYTSWRSNTWQNDGNLLQQWNGCQSVSCLEKEAMSLTEVIRGYAENSVTSHASSQCNCCSEWVIWPALELAVCLGTANRAELKPLLKHVAAQRLVKGAPVAPQTRTQRTELLEF